MWSKCVYCVDWALFSRASIVVSYCPAKISTSCIAIVQQPGMYDVRVRQNQKPNHISKPKQTTKKKSGKNYDTRRISLPSIQTKKRMKKKLCSGKKSRKKITIRTESRIGWFFLWCKQKSVWHISQLEICRETGGGEKQQTKQQNPFNALFHPWIPYHIFLTESSIVFCVCFVFFLCSIIIFVLSHIRRRICALTFTFSYLAKFQFFFCLLLLFYPNALIACVFTVFVWQIFRGGFGVR